MHAAPGFGRPLPTSSPLASADVESGAVKVSDILAHCRALYTPADQSPLIGAGDPMLGARNDIVNQGRM